MISTIQKWASFVRFSHTVFAMTFALAAENTKLVHWPTRLVGSVAAFLALWVMVAALVRATRRQASPA